MTIKIQLDLNPDTNTSKIFQDSSRHNICNMIAHDGLAIIPLVFNVIPLHTEMPNLQAILFLVGHFFILCG